MKKITFYQIIVVLLLLVNIVLFFICSKGDKHRPPHERKHNPKAIVIERLNFNDEQIVNYEKLIDGHKNGTIRLDRKLNYSKGLLYESLREDSNEVYTDSLIQAIADIQIEIENLHLNHFKDIKDICTEEQLDDYNMLTKDLAKVFHINKSSKKKRPHK